ncbi:MAG: 2-amino-4-hydroxy-6-hydroxymethyldihydropteridine diphosphokinase [Bacteroidetes bacterium]|nr:2-amino-4-hydroxy-6-hydroxymethyldihydropteridine diphosphokinase [Bacteroidota bacterium]
MKEAESYLSLGSNLGDRLGYLNRSIDLISGLKGVTIRGTSAVYETEPVGVIDQPPFLNLALGVMTASEPAEFLAALKEIERKIGRVHRDRWREREIDIDIIFYADRSLTSDDLTIPHGRAHLRRFVLQPLSDIAPNFEHPVLHKTVAQLLSVCPDNSGVRRFLALSHPVS